MSNYRYPFGWLPPQPQPRNALLDLIERAHRPTMANALQTTHPTTGLLGTYLPEKPKTEWVNGYYRRTGNPWNPYETEWVPGYWRSIPW